MALRSRQGNGTTDPRLVVPQPPPPGDEIPTGLGDDADSDSDALSDELGDISALSGESYRDSVWYVYRRRNPGEVVDKRSNPNAPVYVAKMVGPFDLEELANTVGGGSFRVVGMRAGRKFVGLPVEIDRPRKTFENERPSAPPSVSVPATADPTIIAVLSVLERIEQKLAAPAPAPAPPPFVFKDMIEAAKLMRPEPLPPQPPAAQTEVKSLVEVFKQGIELGSLRDGVNGGTDWAAIIEKAMPVVEKVLTGAMARRAAGPRVQPGQPVPPARPASHAEVVTEPATTAPPDEPETSHRMAAVVDSLARAVSAMGTEDEIDPADFAVTVETILNAGELSMLRLGSTDRLMAELAQVSDRFPSLATPQARVFVDAVLTALRTPPADAE